MGSFPETWNRARKVSGTQGKWSKKNDETNANKFYKCMQSDVFEKSIKYHTDKSTDKVFAWSLHGVFPGPLGQFTSVTYPRRTDGKHLTFWLGTRDPKRIGLGTKGPNIWLPQVYISLQ